MNCSAEVILSYLNRALVRCTYEAAAEVMGVQAQSMGTHLGDHRREASWVVNKREGEPTGYADHNKHEALHRTSHIITTGEELLRCMRRNVTEFPD